MTERPIPHLRPEDEGTIETRIAKLKRLNSQIGSLNNELIDVLTSRFLTSVNQIRIYPRINQFLTQIQGLLFTLGLDSTLSAAEVELSLEAEHQEQLDVIFEIIQNANIRNLMVERTGLTLSVVIRLNNPTSSPQE